MRKLRVACWLLAGPVVLGVLSCSDGWSPDNTSATTSPIVNGSTESGWEGVGALTELVPGLGVVGAHCTATATHASWLLTSASCLEGQDPKTTLFYVGGDANPDDTGRPTSGSLYAVDIFYPHLSFDPQTGQHDIALVHLAEPLPVAMDFVPTSTSSMDGSDVGQSLLFVGFGENNGNPPSGGGVKRSTSMAIAQLYIMTFTSEFGGSGLCFADMGGPGLQQVLGSWRVVGVNSAIGAAGSDPCQGTYVHTRVDQHSFWISSTMSGSAPSCSGNPSLCHCDSACQASGECDNTVCQVADCSNVYDCTTGCADDECLLDCYLTGTDAAKDAYDALFLCAENNCAGQTGSAWQTCVKSSCGTQLDVCFPTQTGSLTCEQVYDCIAVCSSGDAACTMNCYDGGTALAQQQLDEMLACFADQCGHLSDDDFTTCVEANCSAEIEACMPSEACDLVGGDCPSGSACYPTASDETACFPSDGLSEGAACDPDAAAQLPCADGLVCVGSATDAVCERMCRLDSECDSGDVCEKPVFASVPDVGVCGCTDEDGDGVCAKNDCDDTEENAYPGNTEVCGDGVDNDCDPSTPDDCEVDAGVGGSGGEAGSGGGSPDAAAGSGGAGGTGAAGTSGSSGAQASAGEEEEGGCGCRASGTPAATGWAWLAAALLALGWRRCLTDERGIVLGNDAHQDPRHRRYLKAGHAS